MKAEDIRKKISQALHTGVSSKPEEVIALNAASITLFTGEIAAQLAEMNEHLVKIANPPIVYITQKQPESSLDDFKKPR